jgi:hypothetical protein
VWGALADNLHANRMKRRGIGSLLLVACARSVIDHAPTEGFTCGCWNRTRTPRLSIANGVAGMSSANVGNHYQVSGCGMHGRTRFNS